MFDARGTIRTHYQKLYDQLQQLGTSELISRSEKIKQQMILQGITFQIASATQGAERTIPFDVLPRIIPANDWSMIERGLNQRVRALNHFLGDMYHEQRFIKDGLISRRMIVNNPYFLPEMMHLDVPENIYTAISGIDLIRDEQGNYFVLEDNLRTPSGLSYIFKNRILMMHYFPDLYFSYHVRGLEKGTQELLTTLQDLAPNNKKDPVVVLLTPGRYNSAYFEHAFLAQQMGIDLVEGSDLRVINQKVYLQTISGRMKPVDVIYRRLDDSFLDPLAFNPNSLVGVPGLMNAYRAGNVAIANAPGTGIADDKLIYTRVPDMIRYYLSEEPVLKNVPTYSLRNPEERSFVLDNLEKMVVKQTSLSGGYGMLMGPQADKETIKAFRAQILGHPESYIAQRAIRLSQSPTLSGSMIESRTIDLRPFIFKGKQQVVLPGGLTRVAMEKGSLVVNSSQGGGSKDTWIV
ncbi:circularly permuted type 2 ATP-grasp protein [Sporolactobacillus spathodeae]|uniref:Circularly permuted ATP-grasp superfamily protein n=1 Tax=Sporolactobacillus spathodeae TaxID=1465502 RepID=A0ABS2QAK6_9BACL|nr:circularly permuted type 2 ATP-grasp protein [Sporolactobacillus spathodeae]MBM7658799.1 putative circularly permuted ATP-grasp superfamily protein [Sporolactobacillus spathodeae]